MASPPSSWVDRRGAKRTVPMKVLVLGFCRTGTASMRTALETLGYKDTHHMQAVLRNPPEVDMWNEAIDAKFFGKGKPYGRAEWDQLLGHCQAVTDVPAILFSEELIAAYPDAKVILTTRDPAKWWKSYTESLQGMWRSKRVRLAARIDPGHFGKVINFTARTVTLFLGSAIGAKEEESKARFVEHYANVRRLVPEPGRLLEYEVGEGWDRLCTFLGDPVPETEFPRTNDTKAFRQSLNLWSGMIFRRAATKLTLPGLLVLTSVLLGIYARRSRALQALIGRS
ncbi:P-loop containing nucleoside triphosphate hydrolase protein [Mycena filopes]|nr:P-loop containing nucleoside triphosphate hydrolase protein [Mycena filopes]